MEPFHAQSFPGGMTSIDLGAEIEEIRKRLREMGEISDTLARTKLIPGFEDVTNPMAPHKIKAAKKRKQKRKNGGPR